LSRKQSKKTRQLTPRVRREFSSDEKLSLRENLTDRQLDALFSVLTPRLVRILQKARTEDVESVRKNRSMRKYMRSAPYFTIAKNGEINEKRYNPVNGLIVVRRVSARSMSASIGYTRRVRRMICLTDLFGIKEAKIVYKCIRKLPKKQQYNAYKAVWTAGSVVAPEKMGDDCRDFRGY